MGPTSPRERSGRSLLDSHGGFNLTLSLPNATVLPNTTIVETRLPNARMLNIWLNIKNNSSRKRIKNRGMSCKDYDVASDVGVNFKNVGVLSIESFLFHLFHYTFLQTKHQRKGY